MYSTPLSFCTYFFPIFYMSHHPGMKSQGWTMTCFDKRHWSFPFRQRIEMQHQSQWKGLLARSPSNPLTVFVASQLALLRRIVPSGPILLKRGLRRGYYTKWYFTLNHTQEITWCSKPKASWFIAPFDLIITKRKTTTTSCNRFFYYISSQPDGMAVRSFV